MGKIVGLSLSFALIIITMSFQNCASHEGATGASLEDTIAWNTTKAEINEKANIILTENCLSCHNSATTMDTNLKDLSAQALMDDGYIDEGQPAQSPIMEMIIDKYLPKGVITADQKSIIRDWILILDPDYLGDDLLNGDDGLGPPPVIGEMDTSPEALLYNQYCGACHGNIESSTRKPRTANQISGAINNIQAMNTDELNALTQDQIDQISLALSR